MSRMITIEGEWSSDVNGWASETLELTGDAWLEATLPCKGRLVIEKAETEHGKYHKALISNWDGPDFRVRIYGDTKYRFIKIFLTENPKTIHIVNI